MSSIDERIVKMVFDNSQFDSKVSSTIGSLTKLNQATDDVAKNSGGLSSLGKAFEQTEITATKAGFHIQDVWLKMSEVFEYQIARKIVNSAKNIANALTLEGITDGFKEYELKMGSVQTIMAGTGESLATVNRQLEELNKYSDQTIYSFADMTNNIGKFTNAGVKLDDAVAAIKGIANEAALSGANANEASRAMYNFSQALSAGYVKLIDWKSIENANMATKGFKETLLEVASTVGTVEKGADGMYKILTTNAQGKTMDELVSGTKNFNDSLQQQWMTTEVLTKALKIYATDVGTLSDAERERYETELLASGFTEEQIKQFEELGTKATKAASEIKTFTMLMDTLKEAIGSGWAMTWQYIIGDFEQAKSLWTEVGKVLGGAIDQMSDARNTLIKEGLQTGWEKFTTMEGAAIPESEKFRDVLLDVAKAHGKLTEEQAEGIESTEDLVYSFHEMEWVTGSILTESVDKYLDSLKNLTEEEKKEMGIVDADIDELSNLSDQLHSGALNADEFADAMNEFGGRENIIQGLRLGFHGLVNILQTIGEAFREIFPPLTSGQLYSATEKFMNGMKSFGNLFNSALNDGKKRADELKRAAKGLFSIFDIGIKFIKSFVNALMPATKNIGSLADKLLEAAANIGDFFTELDESITKNKTFETFFENIRDVLTNITEKIHIDGFVQKIKDLFQTFKDAAGPMGDFGEVFNKVMEDIKGGFQNVIDRLSFLKPLVEGVVDIFKWVAESIGNFIKQIGDSLSGVSASDGLSGLTGIFSSLLSGGILYKLFSGASAFSSVGEILDSFGDTLNAFQSKIKASTLKDIAVAVAILAGSLFIVATIDSDKLAGATAAIGAMVTVMAGAMAILMKAVNSFSTVETDKVFSFFGHEFGSSSKKMFEMSTGLKAVSKALLAMGTAILLMAIALKIVSSAAEDGHLWDSFLVVSLMLAELTGVAILLGKFGGEAKKGANNLTEMTVALVIMAGALAIVAKVVEGGNAWEALKIISLMLLELTGIALILEYFGSGSIGGLVGLLAMAASILILVVALKQISDALGEEGNHILEALGILSLMLLALAAATILMGSFGSGSILGGVGAILAAAALLILVQALKQVNDMLGQTDQHVWQSLGVIAAALLILAVGLTAMSATIPGAAALLIASAALVVLGAALKIMGSMDLKEIGKALLVMAGSLLILAVGLTAMVAALPGAAALVVAAAGLTILAGVLKVLGSMSIKEIAKSLLALIAALATIAVIGTILSVVSPLLLLFAAAIIAIGVGLAATGAGLIAFSLGLQMLVAILPLGLVALKQLVETLAELLPIVVEKVMDALGMLAAKIVEYAPTFAEAAVTVVTEIINATAEMVPLYAEKALDMVIAFINVLTEHIPEIAEAGTNYIIALLEAISKEIPRIVDEGYKCAIALINGLADAINNNNADLIAAVDNLMDAVIQAITQWLVEFTPLGKLMPENIKTGIMNGEYRVKDAIDGLIRDAIAKIKEKLGDFKDAAKELCDGAINAIKEKVGDFTAAAENLIAGFIEGLKGSWAGQAMQEAAAFADGVVKSMNSKKGFDEKSPSRKTRQSGIYFVQGLINGLEEAAPTAANSAVKLGKQVSDALSTSLEMATEIASDSLEISPVISPVLDLSNVKNGANLVNSLFAGQSMAIASQIHVGSTQYNSTEGDTNGTTNVPTMGTTFIQNNYSPKALSRMEIYRQTRNQLSMMKGVVKANA